MKPEWTRKRWFVGSITGGGYVVFSCIYTPTRETHGYQYGFCFGPYKTRTEAFRVKAYQELGRVVISNDDSR